MAIEIVDLPMNNGDFNPNWLVVLTILKNMKVNGKDYPIYIMENKKCSKPPTKPTSLCVSRPAIQWVIYWGFPKMGDPKIIQAIAYVQWENHWFGALMFENSPM